MTVDNGTERQIREVLSQAYGNGGTDPLDRVAANNVLATLRNEGWISPVELATIVRAAGGKVVLTDKDLREMGEYDLVTFRPSDAANGVVMRLEAKKRIA